MAELTTSLNARTMEESRKLDNFIQQRVADIEQTLIRTEEETDQSFAGRTDTLKGFEGELDEQVRERRRFEHDTLVQLSGISTKVAGNAIPLEAGLSERVQSSAGDCLRDIQRQTSEMERQGATLREKSQQMAGTSEELKKEKTELMLLERELEEKLQQLNMQLRERAEVMERALCSSRGKVEQALLDLRSEVVSRTGRVHEAMAAKEAEVREAMEQLAAQTR
jgi:hypothetical protein